MTKSDLIRRLIAAVNEGNHDANGVIESLAESVSQKKLEAIVEELESDNSIDDELDDRDDGPVEFSESPAGRDALERWARNYDDLDGAPEGDYDR